MNLPLAGASGNGPTEVARSLFFSVISLVWISILFVTLFQRNAEYSSLQGVHEGTAVST